MPEEKLGIEKLTVVVVAALQLVNKFDDVASDGFQLLPDLASLVPNIGDVVDIVKNGKDAYEEFMDLDTDEKDELLVAVKAELDLNDDDLEQIVEDALSILSQVVFLAKDIRSALKKD